MQEKEPGCSLSDCRQSAVVFFVDFGRDGLPVVDGLCEKHYKISLKITGRPDRYYSDLDTALEEANTLRYAMIHKMALAKRLYIKFLGAISR